MRASYMNSYLYLRYARYVLALFVLALFSDMTQITTMEKTSASPDINVDMYASIYFRKTLSLTTEICGSWTTTTRLTTTTWMKHGWGVVT